ncbi:MAG: efflux RND transporter permease subunit [Acidobacteria bacterium]|nr:efflux RND transporter permease subunit [Acidobacteriota bacterium]
MQKLAEICVRRPVFATMLILSLTVVGIFSFFSLGVDLFPKIDFPTITISVVNPGASPREIETEVTDKIEAAVNTISGIDELRSTSVEGVSQVFVQFLLDKNADIAAQEVRDKINLVVPDLPETAEEPVIQKLDTDAAPVLRIAVSAPRSLREVTEIADKGIKERIESINGVGNVTIVGGSRREIQLKLDPDKMRAFGVTVPEVAAAVRLQNLEVPGGRVDEGSRELTVRTLGRITNPSDFNHIAVSTRGNYPVKLSDIGYAEDGSEELRTSARLNGEPAVTLIVAKQSGTNTVAVADEIKARLEEIKPTLPANVRTQVIGDSSIFIKAAVESIQTHLVEGSILAAIVVFVFLWNFRSTIIAGLAIPTSIIATFGLMAALGYTLNMITMLALTLMVGIVIDDAIVVLENIYRFIEEKGMPPFQAAIEGTREIGLAVMATTLSLLAVFLPVGFMGGIVGRFMSSFGLTASFAVAVSLIVSFTLTPMLAARFIKRKKPQSVSPGVGSAPSEGDASALLADESRVVAGAPDKRMETGEDAEATVGAGLVHARAAAAEENGQEGQATPLPNEANKAHNSKEGRFYRPVDRAYTSMLKWSMGHRWAIVATLASTSTLVERIARDVRTLPGVTDTLVTIGGDRQQLVNSANVYVRLAPLDERDLSQTELMVKARELLQKYPPELRTNIGQVQAISGGGQRNADIQYMIAGPDLQTLTKYSDELLKRMHTLPDVVDLDSSLIAGKPELRVEIDRARAADLGVRVGDIAQSLNTMVAGQKVSTFNQGTDQYDVRLRAIGSARANKEELSRLFAPSAKLGLVSLDNLVRVEEGSGPSAIDRLNRQRQVTLTANVAPGGSQSAVLADLDNAVRGMNLEAGYQTGLVGRSKELGRAGGYFLLAITLSFIFMYMVLAAQFESFIHPVTILLTLPLAIPFGILSLLLTGQTVNIFSGLGLLLLFGVVKKNAILQIDHTNELRAKGLDRFDAIIQANRDRLRPILMTTIALVAGMMPLVISSGPGSGTNRSIGVLVVGGQSLCLLLTLLAVPVFYSLFDDLARSRVFGRMGARLGGAFAWARRRTATAAGTITNKF